MKTLRRLTHGNAWLFGAVLAWSLLFLACASVNRTIVAPAQIAGADYVGSAECATCHSEKTEGFRHATHAKLAIKSDKGLDIGCESCHGAGSKHVQAGGGRGVFINSSKQPDSCFQCHLDKRGEFSLPNAHPVLAGQMSCSDCHDIHSGNAIKGTGTSLESQNETCFKCHTQQKGPFVYEHGALREGCVTCHNPHGSVNAKMLVARDANLCLRCHLEAPIANSSGIVLPGQINAGGGNHNSRLMQGTCWVAGCHEAPHGSNASTTFRY
jgi:predicted CXXCH cytochrome family protein